MSVTAELKTVQRMKGHLQQCQEFKCGNLIRDLKRYFFDISCAPASSPPSHIVQSRAF